MRRIALFSLHSSPLALPGGIDVGGMNVYVRQLALGLADRGLEVDIFTRRTDSSQRETVRLAPGARVVHLSAGPVRRLPKSVLPLHVPAMAAAFRAFATEPYDVLHSHYWISGLVAMRLHRAGGVPFVHMFHTLAKLKEFYVGAADGADSALRADGERCLIGRADCIVGGTEREEHEMSVLYGRAPHRYEVIPPGVDLSVFRPRDRDESRRLLGITTPNLVLFVGRQDRLKGADTLLRAIAALPERQRCGVTALFVGGHDERHDDRALRLASRLGIERQVICHGKVEPETLPTYYSAADLCAVPSAYESFGMVAIEAMACQTPVLAYRTGGLATTITDGKTGWLVTPGDQTAYAQALAAALDDPRRTAIGRRARLSIRDYTWDATATRTLSLYASLVEAGSRRFASS